MFEINNLSFKYDTEVILENININIKQNEKIAILGANGSGKSTLMKLMSGLLLVNEGVISLDGEVITEEKLTKLRNTCGIIFQNPDEQFVGSTVVDDLAFGLENHRIQRDEMQHKIDETLRRFDLVSLKDHDPTRLSGGQKQRAAIASVSILEPRVLIFDESTSMLDPMHRHQFFEEIKDLQLRNQNMTQIMITHDLNEIIYFDRIVILANKSIRFDGSLEEFLQFTAEELKTFGLELPKALKYAKTLATDSKEIMEHYLNIVLQTSR